MHWVRIGAMGYVGRFAAHHGERYPRGTRVVLRTSRGLELGEVLAPLAQADGAQAEGDLLRRVTPEDDLLALRLGRNRQQAIDACAHEIQGRGLDVALLDAELLFDGQTLVFYFLGDEPPELAEVTAALAETYDAQIEFRQFADALTHGCGPDCGTEQAAGSGCGSCGTGCALAAACAPRGEHPS